jgi:hypothetical protein
VEFPEPPSDERWEELANLAHEAFKELLGCADTKEEKESRGGTVAARETCDGGRD